MEVSVESLPGAFVQLTALMTIGVSGTNLYLLASSFGMSCGSVVATIVSMDVRKDR